MFRRSAARRLDSASAQNPPPPPPDLLTTGASSSDASDEDDDDLLLSETPFKPKSRAVLKKEAARHNLFDNICNDGMEAAERREKIREITDNARAKREEAQCNGIGLGSTERKSGSGNGRTDGAGLVDIDSIKRTLTGHVNYDEVEDLIRSSECRVEQRARKRAVEDALMGKGGIDSGGDVGLNDSAMFSQNSFLEMDGSGDDDGGGDTAGSDSGNDDDDGDGRGKHYKPTSILGISKVSSEKIKVSRGKNKRRAANYPSNETSRVIDAYEVGYSTHLGVRKALYPRGGVCDLSSLKKDLVKSVLPTLLSEGDEHAKRYHEFLSALLEVNPSTVKRRKRRTGLRFGPAKKKLSAASLAEPTDPALPRLGKMLQAGRFLGLAASPGGGPRNDGRPPAPPVELSRWAYRAAIGQLPEPRAKPAVLPPKRSRRRNAGTYAEPPPPQPPQAPSPPMSPAGEAASAGAARAVLRMLASGGASADNGACALLHARWFGEMARERFGIGESNGSGGADRVESGSGRLHEVDVGRLMHFLDIWAVAVENRAVIWHDGDVDCEETVKKREGTDSESNKFAKEIIVCLVQMSLDECLYTGNGLHHKLQNLMRAILSRQARNLGTPDISNINQFSDKKNCPFNAWAVDCINEILSNLSNFSTGESGKADADDVDGCMPYMLAGTNIPLVCQTGIPVVEYVVFSVLFLQGALLEILPTVRRKFVNIKNKNATTFSGSAVGFAILSLEEIPKLGDEVTENGPLYYAVVQLCLTCVQSGMAQYLIHEKELKKVKFSRSDADDREVTMQTLESLCFNLKKKIANIFTQPHHRRVKENLQGMSVQFGHGARKNLTKKKNSRMSLDGWLSPGAG
eukprot:CAMPEP_0194291258 /NCGR_PEP_ID=MMETSP0169-20130528/43064_1 /TAXON_ID=218684 /ORGANISM="Corethron pennatum, Strain L29A3" /LENGTH=856 /DNA_ID=CAMNT_0039039087 /DNA_START=126 /DNA_END=2696 /DNA_ORIENTATION=+